MKISKKMQGLIWMILSFLLLTIGAGVLMSPTVGGIVAIVIIAIIIFEIGLDLYED